MKNENEENEVNEENEEVKEQIKEENENEIILNKKFANFEEKLFQELKYENYDIISKVRNILFFLFLISFFFF